MFGGIVQCRKHQIQPVFGSFMLLCGVLHKLKLKREQRKANEFSVAKSRGANSAVVSTGVTLSLIHI